MEQTVATVHQNVSAKDQLLLNIAKQLDQTVFTIAQNIVKELDEGQVKRIVDQFENIPEEPSSIDEFFEIEKQRQKKADLERLKLKENIHLQKLYESKMLNKDLDNVVNLTEAVDDALDEKHGSKSLNLQEHLKEAKSLVKKINDEKKERERKKFEKALLEQLRMDKEIEEREKKMQEEKVLKEQEKDRKKEEMEKRIQQRIEERQRSQVAMKEQTRKVSKHRLYLDLEKKYEEEYIKQQEKERLEKLQEIKQNFKPVHKNDLEQHSRKYDDLLRQQKEQLRKKRAFDGSSSAQPDSRDSNNYQSQFYKKLLLEEKEQRDFQERDKLEKKHVHDRVSNYAKYVKEVYWPNTSEAKRQQLESMKENIRHPLRKMEPPSDNGAIKKKSRVFPRHGTADRLLDNGKQYSYQTSVRGHSNRATQNKDEPAIKGGLTGFNSEPDLNEKTLKKVTKRKELHKKDSQQQQELNQPVANERKPPKDYIREFRNKREQEQTQKKGNAEDWGKLIGDNKLTEQEKYNFMKIKTARLEEKAMMEEQMLAAIGNRNKNDVEKTIEVNDMYIESIKAKLMMLDNI